MAIELDAPATTTLSQVLHPLDPLSTQEITAAVAIIRTSGKLGSHVRFATVVLQEPSKEAVLNFKAGDPIERAACAILLDNDDGATYEAMVSLTSGTVQDWQHIPEVQPCVMLDEFFECENTVKADPAFQAALRQRGITDFSLLMVDPWSAGNYGEEVEQRHRLVRALTWIRNAPTDNGYAHPVDGLQVLVDLNKMQVLRIDDHGSIPVPVQADGNYTPAYMKELRTDLKPLEIIQADGPSFTVHGNDVTWQKWHFRIGFTPREGLVLYTISYADQGRDRPLIYRASLVDMVVPYGDPHPNHNRKNAFDVGEYGIGMLANALVLGCDCLGHIHYFDAQMIDSRGQVVQIKNAICLHEEDYGILWKHMDWRTNQTEVRRSRRLVVSMIATVGNYEYGFFWYFYQDGSMQYEIKLTGIMNTGALPPGETRKYGLLVGPGLYAPNHQHFFCVRLDMMVDGPHNTVCEVHTVAEPMGPDNPLGNAFYTTQTPLRTEQEAQQRLDPSSARSWLITNPSSLNGMGQPVAYQLLPGENAVPFAHPQASVSRRANFMTRHLWVTPYHPDEKYATGDYPNQHPGGAGLPEWTAANRSIENTNVVLWYVMGEHHIPRLEDWPVMPVAYLSFRLRPNGFFDRSPALDVPPTPSHHCHT